MKIKYLVTVMLAVVLSTAMLHAACGIWQADIYINKQGTFGWYAATGFNADNNTLLQGYNFGSFAAGDVFNIVGGQVKTYKNGASDITGGYMYYVIYQAGNRPTTPTFTEMHYANWTNLPNAGDQRIYTDNAQINILNGLSSGNYVIEVYWKATSNEGDKLANDAVNNNFKGTFTVTAPPTITLNDDGISEGSENGEIITVTLENDLFVTTLNSNNWQFENLPAGVTKGTVQKVNNTTVEITLSGNRTVDYDSDIFDLTLTVQGAEFVNYTQAVTKNTGVVFTANNDAESLTYAWANPPATNGLEATLNNEIIDLTIIGGTFISQQVNTTNITVSGTAVSEAGVSLESVVFENPTKVKVNLSWNGTDFDANKTLTLNVSELAYADGSTLLSLNINLLATVENGTATITGTLNENNLNGATLQLTLAGASFNNYSGLQITDFVLNNYPQGTVIQSVTGVSATTANLVLSYNGGDFDTNFSNFYLTVLQPALNVANSLVSNNLTITAIVEPEISLSYDGNISEGSENGEVITVTLTGDGLQFENPVVNQANYTLGNLPQGVSKATVTITSATTANISLSGNATEAYLIDIPNLTLTINSAEIQGYTGSNLVVAEGVLMKSTAAQLLASNVKFPTVNDQLTITFNATQGNAALAGTTGFVYAHTGVTTNAGNWQYTQGVWGEPTEKVKMTSLGNDIYSLNMGVIKDFYAIPQGELSEVSAMAFVFRNETGSIVAKDEINNDIYITVYQQGLNLRFVTPTETPILNSGENLRIVAEANQAQTMKLYIDESLVFTTLGNRLSYTVQALAAEGQHNIRIEATDGIQTKNIESYYYTLGNVVVQALPQGLVDGINYIDDNTVTLVLFAPKKSHVFVLGDFNNWELQPQYFMKRTVSNINDYANCRYWLTITNLTAQQEYVFQYLIDGEIQIADPYADKLSDPWNDKYISSANYPDLIQYPEGKADGIASILQTAQPDFQWAVTDFQRPSNDNLVIYELHIRDFADLDDIKTVKDSLDYLQRLGITAVELMPINEFEGNDSWGYNPSFYFAPDKAYGTKNAYKSFIDECHKRGIAVIVDMVLNHSFRQSPLVLMYYDAVNDKPTADNPWYNEYAPNTSYSWGYDFDHESPYTKTFIDRVNTYWLNEYNVDGFRFDFTKGFTNTVGDGWAYDASRIAILKRMADAIWATSPSNRPYVILEHLADNSEETVLANYGIMLWGNLTGAYGEGSMGYTSDFTQANYKARGWTYPNLVAYMESHDEERIMYKNLAHGNSTQAPTYDVKNLSTALDRAALVAAFYIPVKGPKMIWQFGEIGYDYSIDENGRIGRKPLPTGYYANTDRHDLFNVYSKLINVKKNNNVFKTDNYELSVNGTMKRINLWHPENDVVIIGNFGVTSGSILPNFSSTGTWYDLFAGNTIQVSDLGNQFLLNPGEFRVYSKQPLNVVYTEAIWTGSVDNDWFTAGNWNVNQVPTNQMNVIIPINKSVTIQSGGSEAQCKNIRVGAGAQVLLEGILNVSGDAIIETDGTKKGQIVR